MSDKFINSSTTVKEFNSKQYKSLWSSMYITISIVILGVLFLYFLMRSILLNNVLSIIFAVIMGGTCVFTSMEYLNNKNNYIYIKKRGVEIFENGTRQIYLWDKIKYVKSKTDYIMLVDDKGNKCKIKYLIYNERSTIKNTIAAIIGDKFKAYNGEDLSQIDLEVLNLKN